MDTPEFILNQFETLLEEERAALRTLDGTRVDAIDDEKSAFLRNLQSHKLDGRADLTPRLRRLSSGLRRNAVLLAHARDCLRDVLSVIHGAPEGGSLACAERPARFSLKG